MTIPTITLARNEWTHHIEDERVVYVLPAVLFDLLKAACDRSELCEKLHSMLHGEDA